MTGLQSRFGKVATALVAAGIVAVTLAGCGDDKKQATADEIGRASCRERV